MTERYMVLKISGRLLDHASRILEDALGISTSMGYKLIVVHGGGDVVTYYSRALGVEPRIVVSPSGVRSRYTDREELEVYVMVMAGKINNELTAIIESMGYKAIGVTGVHCGILRAKRKERIVIINEKGRKQVIPGGYTGRIVSVNTSCLRGLAGLADAVVLSPIALGVKGEILNVDGDQAASSVASALGAEYLLLLTDVDGVVVDGELVARIPANEARVLAGKVGPGMNRKLLMAAEAVNRGVKTAIIANGLTDQPVANAIRGKGTIITQGEAVEG